MQTQEQTQTTEQTQYTSVGITARVWWSKEAVTFGLGR